MGKKVQAFQKKYDTKAEKEKALAKMSDAEIQELIDDCESVYGKIFYSEYLKKKKKKS